MLSSIASFRAYLKEKPYIFLTMIHSVAIPALSLPSSSSYPSDPFFSIEPHTNFSFRTFHEQEKQKELAENANDGVPAKKQSAGELRVHKDIGKLNLPASCTITFPNGQDDLMNFEVEIIPDEGYYTGGNFLFSFQIPHIYPHEAPKVKCKTKVYHPNIDLQGNVCLNILREEWKPVLNINTIIYGLLHLFAEPNYEDPLNHQAAERLKTEPHTFEHFVKRAISGGYVDDTYFPSCVEE